MSRFGGARDGPVPREVEEPKGEVDFEALMAKEDAAAANAREKAEGGSKKKKKKKPHKKKVAKAGV